jgi:hypothetical protein
MTVIFLRLITGHAKIVEGEIIYAPFVGAITIYTASAYIFNPGVAMINGILMGTLLTLIYSIFRKKKFNFSMVYFPQFLLVFTSIFSVILC